MPSKRRSHTATSPTKAGSKKNGLAPPSKARTSRRRTSTARPAPESDHTDGESVSDDPSDYLAQSSEDDGDDDNQDLDSDALDEDDAPNRKRKRVSGTKPPRKASARKRGKKEESDEDDYDEQEVAEGMEVVGKVVKAPKTGKVPPGQISKNTFDFLRQLKKPECNDRQWFKLHEPIFRQAEQEWKDFIDKFTEDLVDVDPQIPPLPPKDVIHRIYRDVRFSNDKTPYKTGFSASFSRSGRKGIFACYHVSIKPGGESLLAAGSWCPGKNELQTIRNHIQRDSRRLRRALAAPRFVELFGQPKPGAMRSIFGREDELKVAPKGVDKNHKDIDLLKCRSFAVVHRFSDEDVLKPAFREQLLEAVKAVRPLVYCLNDYMTLPADEDGDDGEEGASGDGGEDGEDGDSNA